ncbi:hypothetical protein SAFG77S_13231 [Streptomyces afghaniensis]
MAPPGPRGELSHPPTRSSSPRGRGRNASGLRPGPRRGLRPLHPSRSSAPAPRMGLRPSPPASSPGALDSRFGPGCAGRPRSDPGPLVPRRRPGCAGRLDQAQVRRMPASGPDALNARGGFGRSVPSLCSGTPWARLRTSTWSRWFSGAEGLTAGGGGAGWEGGRPLTRMRRACRFGGCDVRHRRTGC